MLHSTSTTPSDGLRLSFVDTSLPLAQPGSSDTPTSTAAGVHRPPAAGARASPSDRARLPLPLGGAVSGSAIGGGRGLSVRTSDASPGPEATTAGISELNTPSSDVFNRYRGVDGSMATTPLESSPSLSVKGVSLTGLRRSGVYGSSNDLRLLCERCREVLVIESSQGALA